MNRDAGFAGADGFSDGTSADSAAPSTASLSAGGADVDVAVVKRDRPRALNAGRARTARAVELVGAAVSSMAFSSVCFSSVDGAAVDEVLKLKRLRAAMGMKIYFIRNYLNCDE